MWHRLKRWMAGKTAGVLTQQELEEGVWQKFPLLLREAVAFSCSKVQRDKGLQEGSSLGREPRRDEASEWTKHFLNEQGIAFKDSDIHLACELCYRRSRR